ncbi:CAP-Gly domain-containing linker protein 1 [Dorcoceras hygrometricum]|uniref:CAP-Gly domain-containing linker protein 1 n=1 Tax=Dorcoceras hygrometricum TaxID=472368 RepID=A0A2Z7AQ23_9LAMI|nr:CAP-Gly domain-containing linker protein 1 [Dorcoceras hygrometricum]
MSNADSTSSIPSPTGPLSDELSELKNSLNSEVEQLRSLQDVSAEAKEGTNIAENSDDSTKDSSKDGKGQETRG